MRRMRIKPLPMRVMFFPAAVLAAAAPACAFDCLETKCPQMRTCAEAHYKLTVCGHKKRDADNDGIPCESLCGADMATYRARVKAQAPDAAEPGSEPEQAAQSIAHCRSLVPPTLVMKVPALRQAGLRSAVRARRRASRWSVARKPSSISCSAASNPWTATATARPATACAGDVRDTTLMCGPRRRIVDA